MEKVEYMDNGNGCCNWRQFTTSMINGTTGEKVDYKLSVPAKMYCQIMQIDVTGWYGIPLATTNLQANWLFLDSKRFWKCVWP